MNRLRLQFGDQSWLLPLLLAAGLAAGLLPWLATANPILALALVGGLAGLVFLIVGWPFSAVFVLIAAAVLTRFRFEVGPISVRPEHIAVLAVATLGSLQLLLHKGKLIMPAAAWLALAWWGFNLLAALFFSPVRTIAVQNALRVGFGVLTFILMINLIPDRRSWWWALAAFLAIGVAEAAFGIVARALYPAVNLGVQVSWNFTEPIPYGTFEEGNLFGSHTASWALVLLLIILALGGSRRRWGKRIWLVLGLGVLLAGLFLSLSRAAWLMFAVGAGIAWALYRPRAWHQVNRTLLLAAASPFTILLVLGLAPILPSSLPFVDRLQSFLNLASDATFSARLSDWSLAWNDWLQQPLTGWGPGSFFLLHGELRANPAWIANLSLRLLQETGLLGALAFLGYGVALLLPTLKTLRRPLQNLDRAALLGLVISYVVLLGVAYQSTDGIWLAASWVHAGLIAAGTRVSGDWAESRPRPIVNSSPYPILFVHSSDEMYGSDVVLLELARRLDPARFRPLVLTPTDIGYEGLLSKALKDAGIEHRSIDMPVLRRRYLTPKELPGFLRNIRAWLPSHPAPDRRRGNRAGAFQHGGSLGRGAGFSSFRRAACVACARDRHAADVGAALAGVHDRPLQRSCGRHQSRRGQPSAARPTAAGPAPFDHPRRRGHHALPSRQRWSGCARRVGGSPKTRSWPGWWGAFPPGRARIFFCDHWLWHWNNRQISAG